MAGHVSRFVPCLTAGSMPAEGQLKGGRDLSRERHHTTTFRQNLFLPSTAERYCDMESEIATISKTARECRDRFPKCLARFGPSEDQQMTQAACFLQEYHARFNAWTTNLGVLAVHSSSLDHRLRNYAQVRDIILGLLDKLRRNLLRGWPTALLISAIQSTHS